MAIPPPEDPSDFVPVSVGKPYINIIRVYNAVSPFDFQFEFRQNGMDNWTETIEGDTTVDLIVSEEIARKLQAIFPTAYSLVVSLMSDIKIYRRADIAYVESGVTYQNYVYDSYYIQSIRPIERSRNYIVSCVGAKEYLGRRLAIPSGVNSTDGTISVPDGSQEAKPIPSSQILAFTSKTYKGIVAGLIAETSILQELPIYNTGFGLTGSRQRTYLLKDMRPIKEAIDNMIDDVDGTGFIFDGGYGSRDFVGFLFTDAPSLERGMGTTKVTDRNSAIFTPSVELTQADSVNNLWAVGSASDGNILLAHKTQGDTSENVLLQLANTERNDISTPQFLLDYTLGILQRSGQSVRTMALRSGLTNEMFATFVGNYIYFMTPDHADINLTMWYVVQRKINTGSKDIEFDLVEVIIDNNGNGIPDRDESL